MDNKNNRSGTSQNDKALVALEPDYVSVEERSIGDLLAYLREYAQSVNFYNENNKLNGSWKPFLDFSDNEILELAELIEDPAIFSEDSTRLEKYSKPHLALLLTFLKLLQYPKEKFAALTEKNVEYFYKNVLHLEEKAEVPDQVHVIFSLAKDVKEHLLQKGTLLNAGKDNTGTDLHYQVTEEVVLNTATITDIKTIHLSKTATDLKYVHQSNDQGDVGFEKMLCVVLGGLSALPPYYNRSGQAIPVNAAYLRTDLYKRIKGKERDEINIYDAAYILESLCFKSIKDFMVCLDLLYREINRGYAGVTYPADQEWEQAYTILAEVHQERIARSRRAELKAIHRESGFEAMMEYVFGEPNPGDMLYKMPNNISTLLGLADASNEAARQYIETKLCMTVEDFRTIMAKKDVALTTVAGEEVYALLETAWTKKREYQYPKIGSEIINGFYADTVYASDTDTAVGRFKPFANSTSEGSSETIQLGFAVNSPLLRLAEGEREIELIVSCKSGSIDTDKLSSLTVDPREIFVTSLSTAVGWHTADNVDVENGKFIIKPEQKEYDREDANLICDIAKFDLFDESTVNGYVGFANGKVYQIDNVDAATNIMKVQSTGLTQDIGTDRFITRLVPKTFVAELAAKLALSKYATSVVSTVETFDQNYQGKYFIDDQGKIFLVKEFISASEVNITYCGALKAESSQGLGDNQRLLVNKVWQTIAFEYDETKDPSGIAIASVYSAEKDFQFEVTDAALKVTYPAGAKAQDLLEAWEDWKDNPLHEPGRYEITGAGSVTADLRETIRELELTGEVIKRYESLADNGIRVTYHGRPVDTANLLITEPSGTVDQAAFFISGNTLTITPGRVSQTANQIVADWRLWLEEASNSAKGFQIESKDGHLWEAVPVSELALSAQDKQVKKCEINNLYGVGIRVWYTGPVADEPKLILKENDIDLFDFDVSEQTLTVQYPSSSTTSADDLVDAWMEWKASELNNPENFEIETMGDGLWTIEAQTEKELQASENRVIECTIDKVGIIARYKLADNYQNAVVELVKDQGVSDFSFGYSDLIDTAHEGIMAKKLTIQYPPLPIISDPVIQADYQKKHVQALLSKWNREYKKQGFSLLRQSEDAQWTKDLPENLVVNFMDNLNYVCTINPDGFVVKYTPAGITVPYSEIPKAQVVIRENDNDTFAFQLSNDYTNNIKTLFINYPTSRKKRTVTNLLLAWKGTDTTLLDSDSLYFTEKGVLKEFGLALSGTGKWEITGITELDLTAEITPETAYTDAVNQKFFSYQTTDVNGFTILYAGPNGVSPQVTLVETEADYFSVNVVPSYNQLYDLNIGEKLTISYPQRSDKRRLVDLLKVWQKYKKEYSGLSAWIFGFDIVDTSPVLEKRAKSALLATGDRVRTYQIANGVRFCYIGHRDNPIVALEEIVDFSDAAVGGKLLWDNGEIFTITEKQDSNTVKIAADTQNINNYDQIKLYAADAICLETLKFTIRLDENFPAIVSLPGENLAAEPAVRILLNPAAVTGDSNSVAIFYDCFKSVIVERIDLKVGVKGATDVKMRGDLAMINPDNPFIPFGQTPVPPARFYFANREICEKKLDFLQVNVNWAEKDYLTAAGLPDMAKYYYAYSHSGMSEIGTIKNEDFEVNLQFLDKRSWIDVSEIPQNLFSTHWSYDDFTKQTFQGILFTEDEELPKDPLDWPRYYKMELSNQGFLNEIYPDLLTGNMQAERNVQAVQSTYDTIKQEIQNYQEQVKAAKLSEAEARESGYDYYQPVIAEPRKLPSIPQNDLDIANLELNLPYSPEIQSLTIDYSASAKLIPGTTVNDSTEAPVRFFRFHPFGYDEIGVTDTIDDYLLPQYDQMGYMFIGIENTEPLQTVSLLFQMVSGSGDVNLTIPEVNWSYLAGNQWVDFTEAEIIKDKTFGMENTGIIRLSIPEGATTTNTVLPGQRCWLRAAVPENIAAFPDILDIRAQAVCLTYLDQGNDPQYLATPLAANSINELETRDPEIKKVEQPFTSFNGKPAERSDEFNVRVSERLKHKNRALTLDDYEKLILSQFPQIHKVKCMPQDELTSFEPSSQGEIVIIVILKNCNSIPFFPLKPKTPANLLEEIKEYIEPLMPPLVNVTIRNPQFEEVTYRLAVKFIDGYDQGFYINQLNDDIKRFLSPWAYEQDADISFGSAVYSSALINYLEKKSYIDYIANFNPMQQTIQHAAYAEVLPLFLTDDNVITTKYPDSILVSADSHVIDVITTEFFDPGAFRGIGHMKIGSDFWVDRPGAIFSVGLGQMEIEAWPVLRYAFADIPVKLMVTATVKGVTFPPKEIATQFSRKDSQQIWDKFREAGYFDQSGNVDATKDFYAEDFYLFDQPGQFAEYLKNNLSNFTFEIVAANFDPTAGKQDEFSCSVQTINCNGLETAAINVLKAGAGFDGISQYPFIVY